MVEHTQLITVISPATANFGWVPVAMCPADENVSVTVYSGQNTLPAVPLRKWPYLRSPADLDEYARQSKATFGAGALRHLDIVDGPELQDTVRHFNRSLKAALGQ
jgi:hypothetical protein